MCNAVKYLHLALSINVYAPLGFMVKCLLCLTIPGYSNISPWHSIASMVLKHPNMKQNKTKTNKTNKFKLDPKRAQKMEDILEAFWEDSEDEAGKVKEILLLYTKGFEPKEIVAYGYNRTTVYRQTGDYKKLRKAPALQYMGFELFETRVRKYMAAKKVTRDKAVDALMEKDLA